MDSNYQPRLEGENIIDSADGKERVRWLLTKYLRRPPFFIRAINEKFDDLMCDPEGWVWGIVLSSVPKYPNVKIIRCTDYLICQGNVVVEQPLRLAI